MTVAPTGPPDPSDHMIQEECLFFSPLLVAASIIAAQLTQHSHDSPVNRPTVKHNIVSVSKFGSVSHPGAPAPAPGELAPDFTYQSSDYLWQNLHNILERGSVLLVFGAADAQLAAIERERSALLTRGITPLVVVDRRDVEAWTTVQRLSLGYSLLADPRSVIGEQYGVLDPAMGRSQAAWFVIDRAGVVCRSGIGTLPEGGWDALAAEAMQSVVPATSTASADEN